MQVVQIILRRLLSVRARGRPKPERFWQRTPDLTLTLDYTPFIYQGIEDL
jgi:hypothetical protein